MTTLDKVIIIKDSINKIINIVYDEYDNGVITDIFPLHTKPRPRNPDFKYRLVIYYYNTNNSIDIGRDFKTNVYYFKSIVSKLIGVDAISVDWGFESDIEELYKRLLDVSAYSDEELKLYFKLTS